MRKKGIALSLTILMAITALVIMALVVAGCGRIDDDYASRHRFGTLGDEYRLGDIQIRIMHDTATDIVYMLLISHSQYISLCPMYDEDGKPMTLESYNKSKGKGGEKR